ncbi:glycosyltransferase family 4 protein [Microcella pacifica]|uniref:D-inositol 3-phosphate glycosyltransferase n=1 Tax=Microcella pacifica TaxID=2591847 RepID=A0A9E5JNF1_9MICO|nr:glycosyltransferase family 4 protein [Microcella pacifica]NHF63899.1 glycosyltransferase family 4 protein [Microcella pacifica]
MRILIASRLFLPEPAVAATRLGALARELAARGHEVEVLTSRPPRGSIVEDEPGVRVRRWPVLRNRQGAVRGYVQYLSFDVPLLARLLLARRADVVVVEPPPTTGTVVRWASRLRRTPYVYYAADILSDAAAHAGTSRTVVGVVRRLERAAVRGAARVLSVSTDFTERLLALGAQTDSIAEVGNGADTRIYTPDGPAVKAAPYALYAGTASEVHGAAVFVDALEHVDGLRLVYLGSGTDHAALREAGERRAPGRVDVLPTVAPAEAARWLRGATVALASARPASGDAAAYRFFPAKLHAAAACGTPILYAGEGSGAVFAEDAPLGTAVPYDPRAVGAALQRALDAPATPEQRAAFAAWARKRVSLAAVAGRAADAVELAAATPHGRARPAREARA